VVPDVGITVLDGPHFLFPFQWDTGEPRFQSGMIPSELDALVLGEERKLLRLAVGDEFVP
jgi:hypothetical protein